MKRTLSSGAKSVLADVLAAMQNADEIGGTESYADYIALMDTIADTARVRAETARANAPPACPECGSESHHKCSCSTPEAPCLHCNNCHHVWNPR